MPNYQKVFKVRITSYEQYQMFEMLRIAYGFRNLGGLCSHLLTKEAEAQGLVDDKIKDKSTDME